MKKILVFISVFISIAAFSQGKKFQINGAARSNLIADDLSIASDNDSITPRKSNYGQTLLDLGVSVYPNENTEVIGMFRIVNASGGFWGGGTAFNVRQLTLKGVAGNYLKYQIGDIDLKMSPYTLYNTLEEGVINEADAFSLRREIVHYDMFYTDDNTWRMQGGRARFGLEFAKYLNKIDFDLFLTRQRVTDGILVPERLFGGGSMTIHQSKNLNFKLNSINLFDLSETTVDSARYSNSVITGEINYNYNVNDGIIVGFSSEIGQSTVNYIDYADTTAPKKFDDSFLDAAVNVDLVNVKTKLSLGLKDVGPDFYAAGAQSKRIGYQTNPYNYSQITNASITRPVTHFDILSGTAGYEYKLSQNLQAFRNEYNNASPYGAATPNRRGIYLNATRTDTSGITESFVEVAFLNEIRGSGTQKKKSFLVAKAGTDVYINDFIGWKKWIKVDLGAGYESTNRKGESFEKVSLSNMMLEGGLTLECLENLDLLVGAKFWMFKGNEFYAVKDIYNDTYNYVAFDVDYSENVLAGGARYRFNDKTSLSAQYQMFKFDEKQDSTFDYDYGISQLNVLFNMLF